MVRARLGLRLVAGCLLLCGAGGAAHAAPTVVQMLQYQPKQPGVDVGTPAADEHSTCEVKLVTGARAGSSGWLLLDGRKRPVRRFFDSDGDKRIDVWSYYKEGLEVYREVDGNANGNADQFRWLNSAGMKWGVDSDEDGKVDAWKEISSEEVAQEAFQAVATRDYRRLQALFINEAELQSLGLGQTYVERIKAKLQSGAARFQATVAKVGELSGKDLFGRVESAPPQCVPGESIGTKQDLYRYPTRTVLYETSPKNHEWIQTGEMVKVGNAWRLLDVPTPGTVNVGPGPDTVVMDPESQKLMEQIADLDKNPPQVVGMEHSQPAVDYYRQRVALIQQMLPKLPANEQENWVRQVGDNLATAALHSKPGDTACLEQLRQVKEQTAAQMPNTNLAGYMTFRVLWAEYAHKLSDTGPGLAKTQTEWMEKLSGFVTAYPRADDTPDALLQLAMGCEFTGKEDEAKRWYTQLHTTFPQHPLAAKAEGSVRRLGIVGQKMPLAGKTVTGAPFDMSMLAGKVVAVYYWASYCESCERDLAKLGALAKDHGSKGFEVVTINLDEQPRAGAEILQKAAAAGHHLCDGGMNSVLATQYGILGLPSVFLIGKDGNVISRSLQVNDLADEIRKAQ